MRLQILFVLTGFLLSSCYNEPHLDHQADFNLNWRFQLEEIDSKADYSAANLDDSEWRLLDVPHDWVIEDDFDSTTIDTAPATGFIYGGGIGWYRKHFNLNLNDDERAYVLFDGVYNHSEVYLNGEKLGYHPYGYSPFYFDLTDYLNKQGNNTLVVKVDRSKYADSRWYTGAGIYRNVELLIANDIHVPIWGTFITTPEVSTEKALVVVEYKIENSSSQESKPVVKTEIIDRNGDIVASKEQELNVASGSIITQTDQYIIANPDLWGIARPNLYTAKHNVYIDDKLVSNYETTFGIRSIRFDPATGFYLNGENMKIKGVCLHHTAGLVGAAVPKDVWRRRLEILRDAGTNAIRISHNPGSEEFLDLCDEMGFLVQDEFFDEWDNPKDKRENTWEKHSDYVSRGYAEEFEEWAEYDLKNSLIAHRNHPSIFQWSIGNEIEWTYPRMKAATGFFDNMDWDGNYFWSEPPFSIEEIQEQLRMLPTPEKNIGSTGSKLAEWTRELDTTRPVTGNFILPSASHETEYGKSVDIVGYSYRRVLYDYGHKHYPEKVIMGTENLAQYHEWKAVIDRPWISGTFLWTGIDYMGESSSRWPVKGTASGMLDLAGFPRGSFHMMKSLWSEKPHIYIATQTIDKSINKIDPVSGLLIAKDPEAWKTRLWEWHDVNNYWNYSDGELISVEVYSNLEELELMLNGKSFGKRKLEEFEDHVYKWAVPYADGELTVKGSTNENTIISNLVTAGEVSRISAVADQTMLKADGYSVVHIDVQLTDNAGNPVKTVDRQIEFIIEQTPEIKTVSKTSNSGQEASITGYSSIQERMINNGENFTELAPLSKDMVKAGTVVRVLGVDNGSIRNVQKHNATSIMTHEGRALLILQSGLEPGLIKITPVSEGLESNYLEIKVNK